MIVVPFDPVHVGMMKIQPWQSWEVTAESMADGYGDAWSGLVDGVPVASAGLVQVWPGRAYAWALLSQDAGRHMTAITRAVRLQLERAEFHRVEMAVDVEFVAAARWAVMLGFELEAKARKYMPNGRDAWIFARV